MNENKNIDPNSEINRNEEDIEWDNGEATYGHKRADFKRKDQPDELHLLKAENDPTHAVNENLNQELKILFNGLNFCGDSTKK